MLKGLVSAEPNVRAEAGPTAGRQARAGEKVRVPPDRAWWPAVGPRLERGVRRHAASCCMFLNTAMFSLATVEEGFMTRDEV